MQPFKNRLAGWHVSMRPIVAFDQQIIHALDRPDCYFGCRKTGLRSEFHAERFVENNAWEALDGRLEDMRARRTSERERDVVPLDAHGDFVLRARERQAYPFVP